MTIHQPQRIIRRLQVLEMLGANSVGYLESEINDYIAKLANNRQALAIGA